MKFPRIFRSNGWWLCRDDNFVGFGKTFYFAYYMWRAKLYKDLPEWAE